VRRVKMERMPRWKMALKLIDEIWNELCGISKGFQRLREIGREGEGRTDDIKGMMVLTNVEEHPFDYESIRWERDKLIKNIQHGERLLELFRYLKDFSFSVDGRCSYNIKMEISASRLAVSITFGCVLGKKLQEAGVSTFEGLIDFWKKKLQKYEEQLAFLEEEISSYGELLQRRKKKKKLNKSVYSRVTA